MRAPVKSHLALAAVTCLLAAPAHGDFVRYLDRQEWENAVGPFTTIDFTGFPGGTIITDQYAEQGVLFRDGDDVVLHDNGGFPNDGWGLRGGFTGPGPINTVFNEPQMWLAVDYPGEVYFRLYSEGELIGKVFGVETSGAGNFLGITSTTPFDAVSIIDPVDNVVFIDDLHFGVPAPGALALLGLAALVRRRRRT